MKKVLEDERKKGEKMRVIYEDGEDERVMREEKVVIEERIDEKIIVGRKKVVENRMRS